MDYVADESDKDVEYAYDVFDRRVGRNVTVNDGGQMGSEHYVYDGAHIALVLMGDDENAVVSDRYLYGPAVDMVLAEEHVAGETVDVTWMLADNQGSVRDVVQLVFDEPNTQWVTEEVTHLTYTGFGSIATETNSAARPRFTYTGREFDDLVGAYYNRARWYDPVTSRFLSEDPIGFLAGDTNLSRYCWNSPMNWTDPSGRDGFVSGYWYYLWHPTQMDSDLATASGVAWGTAGVALGGVAALGAGAAVGAGVGGLAAATGTTVTPTVATATYVAGAAAGSYVGGQVGGAVGSMGGPLGEQIGSRGGQMLGGRMGGIGAGVGLMLFASGGCFPIFGDQACFVAGTPVAVFDDATLGAEDAEESQEQRVSLRNGALAAGSLLLGLAGWRTNRRSSEGKHVRRRRKGLAGPKASADDMDDADTDDLDIPPPTGKNDQCADCDPDRASDAGLKDGMAARRALCRAVATSDEHADKTIMQVDEAGPEEVEMEPHERMHRRSWAGSLWLVAGLLLASFAGLATWSSPAAKAQPRAESKATATCPIEKICVGQRVMATDANAAATADAPTAVDPPNWRKIVLRAEWRWQDGTMDVVHAETLQPLVWIESQRVKVGAAVPLPLDLVEMGLPKDLRGTVVAIEPCPAIKSGPGRVVLTTVDHLNTFVWELTMEDAAGRQESIRPTGYHKFFSRSRDAWVSVCDLREGEVLDGVNGTLTVAASRRLPGIERVYNMTVENEHVYRVAGLGALVHNNGCEPGQEQLEAQFKDAPANPGNALSPYRLTQPGETFIRYESGNPAFTRMTEWGGVTPGTYAAPASDGLIPLAERGAVYNLPNPEILRPSVNILKPPPGTLIIGPKPVVGGTGGEVIFPGGF